jgi:hypothetical protein
LFQQIPERGFAQPQINIAKLHPFEVSIVR